MSVTFPGISAVSAETKSSPKGTAIPITPINGWTNYGGVYPPLTLYSFSNGMKMLIGMVRAGTKGSRAQMAAIPTEHRPKYHIVSIANCGNKEVVRVDVSPAGEVLLRSATGTGDYNFEWVGINAMWMDSTLDV